MGVFYLPSTVSIDRYLHLKLCVLMKFHTKIIKGGNSQRNSSSARMNSEEKTGEGIREIGK
jgi:hypothetical protein